MSPLFWKAIQNRISSRGRGLGYGEYVALLVIPFTS